MSRAYKIIPEEGKGYNRTFSVEIKLMHCSDENIKKLTHYLRNATKALEDGAVWMKDVADIIENKQ